nr:TRAP transporter fused permease subunit [Halomonas socia]
MSVGMRRNLTGIPALLVSLFSLAIVGFHLYAAQFGAPQVMVFRPVHLAMYLSLIFLIFSPTGKSQTSKIPIGDGLLAILAWLPTLYILWDIERITTRYAYMDSLTQSDWVFGILAIILTLEACRRTLGWTLVLLVIAFAVHALYVDNLPFNLPGSSVSGERFIDHLFLTTSGLWGSITGISATYVLMFVLFGAVLERAKGGELFMGLATSVAGRFRGGMGKASVVSSGFFGCISGAAVANVYATGTFTIPMMKRSGFKPDRAAGIEAVSSASGQLVPPIMGSAAFLIADFTRTAYLDVVTAAALPALLYLLAVMLMVHLEAIKNNIPSVDANTIRLARKDVVKYLHLLLPLAVIVAMLLDRRSAFFAAYTGVLATFVAAQLRSSTRMDFRGVLVALEVGACRIAPVAASLFAAAILVGIFELTGLGLRFTSILLNLTGGVLLPTMLLVMASCIILGMGLPTAAAYMIAAIFGAPALIELGITPLAAHLFVFYFAILSAITPPVAMAAYAAATIAETPLQRTGFVAMKLGLAIYLIPFVFAYNSALLLDGSFLEVLEALLTACIGIASLAIAVQGFFIVKAAVWERLLTIIAAGSLLIPGWESATIGAILLLLVAVVQFLAYYKLKNTSSRPSM